MIDYSETTGLFRTPGGQAVTFAYRPETNDWNTLAASVNEDEYHLPRGIDGTAVDVGGYLGSVGIALAMDNPKLRVIIIEPVPDNADLIERNIALNGVADRVTLIRGAVGRGGESVDVWYRYTGTPSAEHHAFVGNSTIAYDNGGELPHETVTYRAIGLRDLIAEYGPIRYLKIDTEGAEWAFLPDAPLTGVREWAGEWHPVRGHVQEDITRLLGRTHSLTFSGPKEGPGGFHAVLYRNWRVSRSSLS